MKKKYAMKKREDLPPLKETLKQKIQLKAQRIRRYEKRKKFYRQNNTFKSDEKNFYRELGSELGSLKKELFFRLANLHLMYFMILVNRINLIYD